MASKILTGYEFKKKFGNCKNTDNAVFYKIMTPGLVHRGYKYKIGVNLDIHPFKPVGKCQPGGFYFTTMDGLPNYVDYGTSLGIVTIPDHAFVYVENERMQRFKTDMLVLESVHSKKSELIDILDPFTESSELIDWVRCRL